MIGGPEPLNVQLVVLLLVGGCALYITYTHPGSQEPLLIAVGVVTLFYLLMGSGGGTR